MTRRAVMQRAHEIARRLEGDYHARMSLALRQAWTEARLLAAGGRRWQKDTMDRIYLNDLTSLYGLRLQRYNTGNICYAELDGERISNSSARQIASMLASAKVWYDCLTGRLEHRGLSETAQRRIMASLQRMGVAA